MTDPRTFAIIGASLTGAKAAETLRDNGFDGRLVLVGAEHDLPYERPPLSKQYLNGHRDARDKAFVHDADWYRDNNVELRLGVCAIGLDVGTHTVTFDAGEPLQYDKLLLATGSRPRQLRVPGGDLDGVHYLRTLPDADALLHRLHSNPGRVVVVGGGWIGLETAAAARSFGADVTVVEMEKLPLSRVLGDEVATVFADVHRAHGVAFRFDTGVSSFTGNDGRLTGVTLSYGEEVPADVAIVGIGIEPVTDLAIAAGLAVDNGVVTDERLRTSDPDVYAAGDVASSHNPLLGHHLRVEHWANALNGGPAAAISMLRGDVVYDRMPYFFSDQYESGPSIGMEYSGWAVPGGYDRVVFRGDPAVRGDASPEFVAFWMSGDRVLAGMNVNVWDVQDQIQALARAGLTGTGVDVARLADPAVPLDEIVASVRAAA